MKLETNLVHENGQYIHDGDPFYEGEEHKPSHTGTSFRCTSRGRSLQQP